jgi:hypothetical protein
MAAVTLIATPDPLALTKGGRMVYQFQGSGRVQTTGIKAAGLLLLVNPIADGTLLVLRFNGQVYTLKFKTTPSAADEFAAGNSSAAYADALMAELQAYYPIREAFTLSRNDPNQLPGIIFTAKQPGTQYNITVDLPVGTPFGWGTTTDGANALIRTRYSIYVEVWMQNPGTDGSDVVAHYSRAFRTPIETDTSGAAQFDVGSILHSLLSADWPSWNINNPTGANSSHRKYFVVYGEAFGSPLQIGKVFQDQVRHAYLGGSDYISRAGGGLAFLSGRNSTPQDDTALRFGPILRYVRPNEPQWLTFLNSRADEASVLLKIVRTYDDDSTNIRLPLLSAQAMAYGQKITFPAGPTQQDLLNDAAAGRTLREYMTQLVRPDGTALSVAYRYILNYDYQPYTRYFAYLNSFGAVDSLTTYGKGSRELNRFFDQAERYVPALYEVTDGQFVDYNLSLQQQLEVATGFRSEIELRGWNDFYRSPKRFHLVDGKALPISITSKSIKQAKDGDTLFAHLFQFVYLFQDDFYSASTGEVGNTLPPLGFVPGGSVTIEVPQIIRAIDDTVPDAVRGLTATVISTFQQAVAWGNHALGGYLNQAAASLLFRRKDQLVSYATDLSDKPATRDQSGLLDVPTSSEVRQTIYDIQFSLSPIRPIVRTWVGEEEPPQPQ